MRRIRTILFLLYSLSLLTFTACQANSNDTVVPNDSTPMLTVREATNCRTGPGESYKLVSTYATGTRLEIAGRYEPANFWLVKSADSPTGFCWMWGEYVDVTGNYESVLDATPPPTSNSTSAQSLIVDQWDYTCDSGTLTFRMNWKDRATDETSYRVFRDEQLLVELPADSTTYTDSFNVSTGQSVAYYLQVFGPAGSTNSAIMTANC